MIAKYKTKEKKRKKTQIYCIPDIVSGVQTVGY